MTNSVPKNDEYPYIAANGRRWGSNQDYIRGEVQAARAAKAPPDAWSRTKASPGDAWEWNTVSDLRKRSKQGNVHARDILEKLEANLHG